MAIVYRIIERHALDAAMARGSFAGSADDQRDGFIHLSAEHQVAGTARKHYAGKSDLVLLHVDVDRLEALSSGKLRWEPSRGGELFPHLYAELPMSAVVATEPFRAPAA